MGNCLKKRLRKNNNEMQILETDANLLENNNNKKSKKKEKKKNEKEPKNRNIIY